VNPNKALVGVDRVRTTGDKIVHLALCNGTVCAITAEERSRKGERRLRQLIGACQRVLDAQTEDT